jgi:hypothetical protein
MIIGYFQGVKQPERGVDHPPSPSADVEERVDLYLYYPYGASWPVLGRSLHLPFTGIKIQKESDVYRIINVRTNKILYIASYFRPPKYVVVI